jgi:predicted RecB family endonuclease
VVVVRVGDVYVVGAVDDWYAVPAHAVRRFLAKLLNVKEEDISLKC